MTWNNCEPVKIKMRAGKYYVGDPCYSVPEHRWIEWLEKAWGDDQNKSNLIADLDGHTIVGFGTAHGDGCYSGSDGNSYPVDAGLLGLVPAAIARPHYEDGVDLVDFPEDFYCEVIKEGGTIILGHIAIATDEWEEEEDPWDEDDEENADA